MRVLVLGAHGQVGYELVGALGCFAEVSGLGRSEVDLAGEGAVSASLLAAVDKLHPDVIINAASYNDVDKAEQEPAAALQVNGDAVGHLGELCRTRRIGLVHYSSDFVFDGRKGAPYVEDDAPAPLGAYGRSKLAGEQALQALAAPAVVFRTSWVFSLRRKSFVSAILRGARLRDSLSVVDDQVGNPTFCRDLAVGTALVLRGLGPDVHGALLERRGVYHLSNDGSCSRYDLAVATLALDPRRREHRATRVDPVPSSAYPTPAARPTFAPLDCRRAGEVFGVRLPPWQDALRRALGDAVFHWEPGETGGIAAPSAPSPTQDRKKNL